MERGQASIEYVVVIALVAVLAGAAGVVADGDALARAVAARIEQAFCIVAHGDCHGAGGPRPCVARSRSDAHERRYGSRVVGRLSDGRSVLVEERSDGTVAVVAGASSDIAIGPEVEATLRVAGRELRAGIAARAGAGVRAGRRWVVPDAAAARAVVARLEEEDPAPVGEAVAEAARFLEVEEGETERYVEFGSRVEAGGVLRGLGLGARADALREVATAVSVDPTSGRRTVRVRLSGGLESVLTAPLARAGAGAEHERAVELVFDDRGGPVELVLHRVAAVRGDVRVAGERAAGGDAVLTDARLDLRDPATRSLAARLIARARAGDGEAVAVAAALARRVAGRARIDVRVYATSREQRRDSAFLGARETIETTETARLVFAAGREPGRGWARRLDCVGAA